MNESYIILAVVAASLGAIASTIQGYMNSGEAYSLKRLTSALISSVFFALGLVSISSIESVISTIGVAGLFISNAILGYGIDQAHSALDRTNSK